MTANAKALTRVCVVDFTTSKVVCDQFVKPPTPILTTSPGTFALTFPNPSFSGITIAAPDPHLLTPIKPSTIFLGHSLKSDLHALELSRASCIDPALLIPVAHKISNETMRSGSVI